MPLFHENQSLKLILRGVECQARVLYETRQRVVVSLETDLLPGSGESVEGRLQQGNYNCSFQTKIQNVEVGLRDLRLILDLAYPPTFKRSLDQSLRTG
ncbi:MAG: hypothetical protein KDK25_07620 [Leptospiraceae bacterium]|nr:hypothetical protein [Leptospiraceae bacterium]